MQNSTKRIIILLIYFSSPLIVILLFYALNPTELIQPLLRQLADILGITAYILLVYEFVLTSRLKFIDKIFGMDRIILFHIIISGIAIQLVITHGIIMFYISGKTLILIGSGINSLVQFILLMAVGVIFLHGSGKKLKKLKYNVAKTIHNLVIITASFLFLHALITNLNYPSPIILIIFTYFYLFALVSWLNLKVIRIRKVKNNPYEIIRVKNEAISYWTLELKPKNRKIFDYAPGQYGYLSIKSQEVSKEFHPFSFTSSPVNKDCISFIIKELGDYTNQIGTVKVGDTAYIEGPYGIFNAHKSKSNQLVLIAGGSGITPFLSLLRYMEDSKNTRKITLIWGIRYPYELFLNEEFEKMKIKNPNLTIIPIVSDDDSWEGECGFIDREKLERLAPCVDPGKKIQKNDYYLCGPPAMVKSVRPALKLMGVNKRKYLHTEKFYR
ncbi:MAG: FAD-binding oxidoreductase [Promethearchaeota archaeon]